MNISEWKQQQTIIGHLKARYTGSQEDISKTVLRLRVERLLGNADLHPPGPGTGSVLIVRKLESPAAVKVSTPSQPVQAGWHKLLRSQVAALYATAARPAFEAVPLDATSVLFADPGEMLTCLTRDLLSGRTEERWYWHQVLRNLPRTPGVALPELWCEQATFVPAVLASLQPAEMFSVITHLTPLAVKQIIHSLQKSFDLPARLFTAIASGEPEGSPSTRVVTGDLPADKEPVVSSPLAASLPPWEQWLPGALLPALPPEACYLLGLGLALYHAPAFARSTSFAAQAARWLQGLQGLQAVHERQRYEPDGSRQPGKKAGEEITHPEQDDAQIVPSGRVAREGEERRRQVEGGTALYRVNRPAILPVGGEQLPPARSSDDLPQAAKPGLSSSSMEPGEHSPGRVPAQSYGPAASTEQGPVQQESRGLEVGTSMPAVHSAAGETKTREFESGGSKALSTDGVPTCLGGVLYLINLLTWLNLPHSWDDDGKFAQMMSGWAIVEVLARGLLRDLYEQYRHDPIWEALALLDGREQGQLIAASGIGLEEERAFRLPASWLGRFGAVVWSAFQQDERLLLYDDAAGFLVVDVPLRGRTFFEAAHEEVKAYSDAGVEVSWHIGSFAGNAIHGRSRTRSGSAISSIQQGMMSHGTAGEDAMIGSSHGMEADGGYRKWLSGHLGEEVLWWLERVMGFVYCVLERALGERFDDAARLAELVLCRHGQLVVSRTHVDLHMSMEEISIAVRRAGLDRDPGWVPDLARIVYFHFD